MHASSPTPESGWSAGIRDHAARRPVRLTARGRRLCRGLLGAALGVPLAFGLTMTPTPGVASSERGDGPAQVVVEPGQSLWSIAVRHEPSGDPVATVEAIRRLNGLSGSIVHPGQVVRLP